MLHEVEKADDGEVKATEAEMRGARQKGRKAAVGGAGAEGSSSGADAVAAARGDLKKVDAQMLELQAQYEKQMLELRTKRKAVLNALRHLEPGAPELDE